MRRHLYSGPPTPSGPVALTEWDQPLSKPRHAPWDLWRWQYTQLAPGSIRFLSWLMWYNCVSVCLWYRVNRQVIPHGWWQSVYFNNVDFIYNVAIYKSLCARKKRGRVHQSFGVLRHLCPTAMCFSTFQNSASAKIHQIKFHCCALASSKILEMLWRQPWFKVTLYCLFVRLSKTSTL